MRYIGHALRKLRGLSPIQRSPLDRLMNRWSLDTSPGYLAMDLMSRVVSPYNVNPLGINPISDILRKSIDFEHLGEASIKLFITATNVHTGRGKVFRNKDITPDVLLASACLPTMFQAIEIDGSPIGTAATPATRRLRRSCGRARRAMSSWCRSTCASAARRPARLPKFSTA